MTRVPPLLCLVAVLSLIAVPCGAQNTAIDNQLDEIARVASAMVDGDVWQLIVTPCALAFMSKKDPRDQWADSDNYDVDDAAFNRVKKTLIRLSMLADFPLDVNLWLPAPGTPARVQIAIRNRNELSQFWDWGKLSQEMFPEMHTVLTTGKRVTVKQKPGLISVLAPVRNSLDEIVGLVEVVTRVVPDVRENVK
ncbi:MAG TPA: hypothetical protein VG273_22970 [Bryobacteraceae bacterium]|jgi:hypothetical protein|nr:hypothetical protein [Bryobacteraceae bacterium]